MRTFLTAITAFFDAPVQAMSADFPGGMHLMEAPREPEGRYMIVTPVSAAATGGYGGMSFTEPSLQFSAYGGGSNDTLAALESWMVKLEAATLTISGGQHFFLRRVADPMPTPGSPETSGDGEDLWGWMVTYEFGIA